VVDNIILVQINKADFAMTFLTQAIPPRL